MAKDETPIDDTDAVPEGIESWITAPEAAIQYGTTASQLTRAAQENAVRRARVKRPGEQRPVYVYDPQTLEEARANGQLGAPPNTAAEGMLYGGAAVLGKMTDLVVNMSSRLIASHDAVTRAVEMLTKAQASQAEAFLKQFERFDKRVEASERVVLEYIEARNDMVNERAEIELEAAKQTNSAALRATALKGLVDHAGPILDVAQVLLKKEDSANDKKASEAPTSNAKAAACESAGPACDSVIDARGETCSG